MLDMLQIVNLHFVVVQLLQQFVVLILQMRGFCIQAPSAQNMHLKTLSLRGNVVNMLLQVVDLVVEIATLRLVLLGSLLGDVL